MNKNLRKGVQGIITDKKGNVLIIQNKGYKSNEWTFFGGGVKLNETYEEAIAREIYEELNLTQDDYKIVAQSSIPVIYDFPKPVEDEGVLYDGQKKKVFLLEFLSKDKLVSVNTDEIKACKWVKITELQKHLIFKDQYKIAREILHDFGLI